MPASLPATMNAIGIAAPGGPDVLRLETRPVPTPGPHEVLIRVRAAGINRPDVVQRQGRYAPPPGASDIPGLEVAGEIVALGTEVSKFRLGSRVCALVSGGGYAEYCPASEGSVLTIPEGVSDIEAAAIPETFFTVWSNVFDNGRLKAGETFLVHGGTSGIGTTAIMLAKAFGATVFATAGTEEKCAACLRLGADLAINHRTQDFVAEVKAATGKKGVDVILDMVGGDYIQRNYEAAATNGRILQIAFMKGSKVEVDFMRFMLKRLTHAGATLRARPDSDKAAIARQIEEKVWPLVASGKIRPVVHATFPLAEASKAHAMMEAGDHIGKIVLKVG